MHAHMHTLPARSIDRVRVSVTVGLQAGDMRFVRILGAFYILDCLSWVLFQTTQAVHRVTGVSFFDAPREGHAGMQLDLGGCVM